MKKSMSRRGDTKVNINIFRSDGHIMYNKLFGFSRSNKHSRFFLSVCRVAIQRIVCGFFFYCFSFIIELMRKYMYIKTSTFFSRLWKSSWWVESVRSTKDCFLVNLINMRFIQHLLPIMHYKFPVKRTEMQKKGTRCLVFVSRWPRSSR